MGGVFGHMSHIYDNPYMTFGQIKDILRSASQGELQGTEKTDGQNLFLSYNIQDGTVRAARNKGNIKTGGMTPADLLAKFKGRGALTEAFINAFLAFEEAVEMLSPGERLEIFGTDTNVYYNAEVMDPANANVINYDIKTLLIHRAGHAAYDRKTGKPLPGRSGKDFGEAQAAKLQAALERVQDQIADRDFKVQVNAVRNLEKLGNDQELQISLSRLNEFMSAAGVTDNDSVGTYIVKQLDALVTDEIPDLNIEVKKLIVKRIMEDYYGVIEGEKGPKKVRGLESRQILKAMGIHSRDTAQMPIEGLRVLNLLKNYPDYLKTFIFPLEDIIHDFAVEMLRSLKSAFILDSDAELERQRAEVGKAITAIENSGNEEAMEILRTQMKKLKNLEGVSSAAEGFVFDYEGNTYKFTGGFAPMNQILGLFKYGRKGIPALAEGGKQKRRLPTGLIGTLDFTLNEQEEKNIALYPGKFKPPHGGHFNVAKQVAENPDVDRLIIYVSPHEHEGINATQAAEIWDVYDKYINGNVEVRIADISPVRSVYEFIDNEAVPGQDLHLVLGEKDIEGGRFKTASGRKEGVGVAEVAVPPQMGGVSATQMRGALRSNDLDTFKEGLPGELNNNDVNDILKILRGSLDELSGVGAVGGYSLPLGAKPRYPKEDEEDKIVNEVMDYLLGISVG